MRRFLINFRSNASDRAAEISARAYNHYIRLKPFMGRVYKPFKDIHSKYFKIGKYGKN